jgi:hypothetical protein
VHIRCSIRTYWLERGSWRGDAIPIVTTASKAAGY